MKKCMTNGERLRLIESIKVNIEQIDEKAMFYVKDHGWFTSEELRVIADELERRNTTTDKEPTA